MDNEKVYAMSFAKIYPLLVAKAEKKGRTQEEVDRIICWLTGYTAEEIEKMLFPKRAETESGQKSDKRRCLRRARGRDRRTADAGNPVSG